VKRWTTLRDDNESSASALGTDPLDKPFGVTKAPPAGGGHSTLFHTAFHVVPAGAVAVGQT
jgi:hypothetical protein